MFKVKAKIWLEQDSKCVLGYGRAELLHRIKDTKSISEAAKSMDMSYSHAWSEIKEISEAVGGSVVETCRGGKHGGSSHLTDLGIEVLKRFECEEKNIEKYLEKRKSK